MSDLSHEDKNAKLNGQTIKNDDLCLKKSSAPCPEQLSPIGYDAPLNLNESSDFQDENDETCAMQISSESDELHSLLQTDDRLAPISLSGDVQFDNNVEDSVDVEGFEGVDFEGETLEEENLQSKKLGTTPIGKLILKMSGPAILSMLVQALYNIVDSIFIGSFDPINGVLALSYALPVQLLVNAFAIGIAVGTGSLISRLLGEGNKKDASLTAQTGLALSIIFSLAFAAIGYFVSEAFVRAYTFSPIVNAGDADMRVVYEMSYKYLSICTCCSFGMMIEIMLNRILQAMGNMIIPMVSQLVGAVTNIILDPIFISVLKLGSIGAAIATVIGQIFAMFIPIVVIILKQRTLDIDIFFKKGFKFKRHIMEGILRVGLPTIVMNSIGSVMYMIANFILNRDADAVWAFGVYFKLQSFAFMPLFGLNQGCIPIMGYNYGANNRKRFDKTFRMAMTIAFLYMAFACILFCSIPKQLLALFSVGDNASRIHVGTEALRICACAFPPAAFGVIMIAMFNSVGHGIKAMLISILRQIGILIPLGYVLSKYTSLSFTGFWMAFPIAEAASVLIFIPVAIHTINHIFRFRSYPDEYVRAVANEQKVCNTI